ncbi:MAG: helix-turn-helix protein [Syntrophorhabdus sp. PtaB.Bin047]|nr:MAG: helix-turn-helix protein [Syntrophorhabdus sp. PtaB.Bin047]
MKSKSRKRRDPAELLNMFKKLCPTKDNSAESAMVPELYRPSCGTEGMDFEAEFCDKCERNREFWEHYDRDDIRPELLCPINDKALSGNYVPQWIIRNGKPCCTEFRTQHTKPQGAVTKGANSEGRNRTEISMEDVAVRLRLLRGKNAQASVASGLGITTRAYQYLEHAKRLPSVPILVKIAATYGVSIDRLLNGTKTDRG